ILMNVGVGARALWKERLFLNIDDNNNETLLPHFIPNKFHKHIPPAMASTPRSPEISPRQRQRHDNRDDELQSSPTTTTNATTTYYHHEHLDVLQQDHRHEHGRPTNEEVDDEATMALNAADRSFLETLQRQEEDEQQDDGDSEQDDDEDGAEVDALRYHRPIWQQVLELGDNERDAGGRGDGALGLEEERGLLVGPLLPATGPTAPSQNDDGIIGPSLLGASTDEQAEEPSTFQDLEELAAFTQDIDSSLDRLGNRVNETAALDASTTAPFFPNTTAPTNVFAEGRTPPRKRKFQMTQQDTPANIMLDSFVPPAQGVHQDNHHSNGKDTFQRKRPRILPHTQQTHHAPVTGHAMHVTTMFSENEAHRQEEDMHGHPMSTEEPRQQDREKRMHGSLLPRPSQGLPHNEQHPISLARKRWNFVKVEQSKAQNALRAAKEQYDRAKPVLQEAEKQQRSVQGVIAETCRECYSFLIQEDKVWYECYQMLQDYHATFGHTLVPRNVQALKKASKGKTELHDNKEIPGACNIDMKNFPNLPKLGRWVGTQRNLYKKGEMEEYKVFALKILRFDFDPVESKWRQQYQLLVDFVREHGHAKVPYNYPNEGAKVDDNTRQDDAKANANDSSFGAWVKRQQYQYKRYQEGKSSEMTADRIRLLNDAGMVWSRREASFSDRMQELRAFKAAHGHINVKEEHNAALARFVRDQRSKYNEHQKNPRASNLTVTQAELLKEIGITEKRQVEKAGNSTAAARESVQESLSVFCEWEHWFAKLLAHRIHTKSYRIPKGDYGLNRFVEEQRHEFAKYMHDQPSKLTYERIMKLKRVKFPFNLKAKSKSGVHKSWDEMFVELMQFVMVHNSFAVPKESRELHSWIRRQCDLFRRYLNGDSSSIEDRDVHRFNR
ncbi:MAG: hypothetical protein SGILL_004232, partial [Bacillariaceae sp.]